MGGYGGGYSGSVPRYQNREINNRYHQPPRQHASAYQRDIPRQGNVSPPPMNLRLVPVGNIGLDTFGAKAAHLAALSNPYMNALSIPTPTVQPQKFGLPRFDTQLPRFALGRQSDPKFSKDGGESLQIERERERKRMLLAYLSIPEEPFEEEPGAFYKVRRF